MQGETAIANDAIHATSNPQSLILGLMCLGHAVVTCRPGRLPQVGNGHDDATLDRINKELAVVKIYKRAELVPKWLAIKKPNYVPDFVV